VSGAQRQRVHRVITASEKAWILASNGLGSRAPVVLITARHDSRAFARRIAPAPALRAEIDASW
jgi:hypothetical protein